MRQLQILETITGAVLVCTALLFWWRARRRSRTVRLAAPHRSCDRKYGN
jgi:uncharacterized iron-regulated membrane protein